MTIYKCRHGKGGVPCMICRNTATVSDSPELAGYVLDLRTNGGRLFILKLVKEVHRKLQVGTKTPSLAALERCIDLEDQLTKMNRI